MQNINICTSRYNIVITDYDSANSSRTKQYKNNSSYLWSVVPNDHVIFVAAIIQSVQKYCANAVVLCLYAETDVLITIFIRMIPNRKHLPSRECDTS